MRKYSVWKRRKKGEEKEIVDDRRISECPPDALRTTILNFLFWFPKRPFFPFVFRPFPLYRGILDISSGGYGLELDRTQLWCMWKIYLIDELTTAKFKQELIVKI